MENKAKQAGRSVLGRGLSALISAQPVSLLNRPEVRSDNLVAVLGGAGARTDGSAAIEVSATPSASVVQFPAQNAAPVSSAQIEMPAHRFLLREKIKPNPTQPRQYFSEAEINELAESIKHLGVLQPLLVRKAKDFETSGEYEIVAGERRWRAAKIAELTEVPAIIKDLDDRDTLEIALVENVQRENLNPVEQAQAYQKLMEAFSLSQQEVADKVGKDRASVANIVRLLKLPAEVLEHVRAGELSLGHAKVILSIKEPSAQTSLAKKAIKEELSVRALEALVSHMVVLDSGHRTSYKKDEEEKADLSASYNPFPAVVDRMRNILGTKVSIKHHKSGRGKIEVEYFSEQELDRLVEQICKQ